MTDQKNSNGDKAQIVTKPENSNCDKNQKPKFLNKKHSTEIVTKSKTLPVTKSDCEKEKTLQL